MSCECRCCVGLNCQISLIGSFKVASPTLCLSSSCTQNFPVGCMKNETLHGQINASYSSSVSTGSTVSTTSSSSNGSIIGPIIGGVIFMCFVACFIKMCRNRRQITAVINNPPMVHAPPIMVHSPPVYGQQMVGGAYPNSYPPQGYPPQGYPPQGYPPQGYPPPHGVSYAYPHPGYAVAGGVAVGVVGGIVVHDAMQHHHIHHDVHHNVHQPAYNQEPVYVHNVTETYNPSGGVEVQTYEYSNDGAGNVQQTSNDVF